MRRVVASRIEYIRVVNGFPHYLGEIILAFIMIPMSSNLTNPFEVICSTSFPQIVTRNKTGNKFGLNCLCIQIAITLRYTVPSDIDLCSD